MGQLRAMSLAKDNNSTTSSTAASRQQQQQQPQFSSSSSSFPASPFEQQHTTGTTLPRNISTGVLSAQCSAQQAAAVAAAAAEAAKQAAAVVPLQDHPNLVTAGHPAVGPLGVLQLTLQVCYHKCENSASIHACQTCTFVCDNKWQ